MVDLIERQTAVCYLAQGRIHDYRDGEDIAASLIKLGWRGTAPGSRAAGMRRPSSRRRLDCRPDLLRAEVARPLGWTLVS
jgi:hypothetical protein